MCGYRCLYPGNGFVHLLLKRLFKFQPKKCLLPVGHSPQARQSNPCLTGRQAPCPFFKGGLTAHKATKTNFNFSSKTKSFMQRAKNCSMNRNSPFKKGVRGDFLMHITKIISQS
jgi:hypothetical protein